MKGNTRIWIAMVLIFVSGVAVGFFGSGLIIRKHVRDFVRRGPDHMNARIVGRILEGMELTEEQREQIDRIVGDTTPEMRRISMEFGNSIDSLATQQYDSIKAVLDEEQAEMLDRRIQEFRDRNEHRREGLRGHRPGRRDLPRDIPPGAI